MGKCKGLAANREGLRRIVITESWNNISCEERMTTSRSGTVFEIV
jgi:hypothetical protein